MVGGGGGGSRLTVREHVSNQRRNKNRKTALSSASDP